MRLEQYGGHPLWKDSERIGLHTECVETSISLTGIQLTPGVLLQMRIRRLTWGTCS